MKNRDYRFYFNDALECSNQIMEFTKGMNYDEFLCDKLKIKAVERNFEIIGEAMGYIPQDMRDRFNDIPYKEVVGLRNILIHNYFGIDYMIVWNIIKNKLPDFISKVEAALNELNNEV